MQQLDEQQSSWDSCQTVYSAAKGKIRESSLVLVWSSRSSSNEGRSREEGRFHIDEIIR